MSNKVTWESFKEYNREAWLEFYMRWAYASWYEWVAQILWLVILVGYFKYTIVAFVEWMNVAEPSALNELIAFGFLFGIVGGIFLLHYIYGLALSYLAVKFNLLD